ncbi:MAG: YajQ family cyclic di-GMP-binding protein [Deltaproteobacteria bacterium]|nr:YajQ family cyclic di-GMP-binding protein [Deltaproteobacteria bacterium]
MPSFDVVSKVELQEVKNALDQTSREIGTRYDFKGSKSSVELKEDTLIILMADDDMKQKAVQEILRTKLSKRGVSLKSVEFKDPTRAGGDMLRQEIVIKQGLSDDDLKKVNKAIKEQKAKVTSQIQGNQIRVTGKKRDDLQEVIAYLRTTMKDLELQFINFRD